jgi:ParB family chromosome partitioning protein
MPDTLTVEYVDPATVLLGGNIRRDPRLDADFVASVRRSGVRTPCPAVRTADGQVMLEFGSRRLAAAALIVDGIPAGDDRRLVLPVFVTGDENTTRDGQVTRLCDQFDENEHRAGLTAQDKAAFVQALLDFKVPQAEIRKRTGLDKAALASAVMVAASPRLMAGPPLPDMVMAARIAEFETTGDEEAVTALHAEVASGPGAFQHAAQLFTDTQAERFGKRDLIAKLAAAGVFLLAENDDGVVVTPAGTQITWRQHINQLTDAAGKNLTEKNHAKCPGHAAYLRRGWQGGGRVWDAVYVCADPEVHGHLERNASSSSKKDPSPDAQEQAAKQRRIVIDCNKKWRSARTVRQNWLRNELLPRKAAPDDALPVIFGAISGSWFDSWDRSLSEAISGGHGLACELLGVKVEASAGEAVAAALRAASPARQQVIALGLVLAAWEARLTDDTWRSYVDELDGHGYYRDKTSIAGHYLLLLEAWGYALSDIEKLPADATRAALAAAKG